MINLGIIVHILYPDVFGDPFNAYELSTRLSKMHKVSVLTWNKKRKTCTEECVNDNFKIIRLKGLNLALKPFFTDYPIIPNLGKEIKANKFDLIHANSISFLTTLFAIRTAKRLGIPSVTTVHGLIAERDFLTKMLQYCYLYSISSLIFRDSTLIICLTKNDANLVSRFYHHTKKIRVIPNAVDIDLFKPNPSLKEENLVLWIGRLIPEKGLEYLIKAAKLVVSADKNIKFMLIGGGPLKFRLLGLIRSLQLENNVFITDPLDRKPVAEMLMKASVFVFPSLREGLPLAILEAMSSGKAIVAFNIPSINEIIKNGFNGILVPPRDLSALAKSILTLIGDKQLANKLGKNARETVVKNYTWEIVLNKLSKVYEEAILKVERKITHE